MSEPGAHGALVGFDTATPDLAVATTRGEEVLYERLVPPADDGRPRHARDLLVLVEEAATAAGGWESIAGIAAGVGPGSFTGLRVGVATARALGQSLQKPILPVVTLEALAAGVRARDAAPGRPVLAVIDARRRQLFAALYGGDGGELWAPFVAGPDEAVERLRGLEQPPVAAGDGSIRFRAELEAAGVEVPPDGDGVHRLSAHAVCLLAATAEARRPEAIEPIYLRPPDAELWRERDRGSGPERG